LWTTLILLPALTFAPRFHVTVEPLTTG
jgi:hypothetical protein